MWGHHRKEHLTIGIVFGLSGVLHKCLYEHCLFGLNK